MEKFYKGLLVFLCCATMGGLQANIVTHITGQASVCVGDQVTYHSPSYVGASYLWNVTGGTVIGASNTDSLTILWGTPGTGMLMVTINIPNGAPVNYFLNVTIHPKPQPKITHTPYPGCPSQGGEHNGSSPDQGGKPACEKVCKDAIISYSTTLNPGSTYQWVATGAQSLTGQLTNTVTVHWDTTGFGSLTVYETNQWGCIDSNSICIEKVDLPIAQFSHQLNVCKGSTVAFVNLSTGTGLTFQWFFGDGGTSTLTNPTHVYVNGGTYTITLIATNSCYCSDTITSTIHVNSLPGPSISCPATLCAHSTATYTTAQAGCTYNWFVYGGVISGPNNQQSVTVTWGAGQLGTLGLYVSGCGGVCSDTTLISIPIIPAVGQINGPAKVCPGDCEEFSLPHFSGTHYTWTLNSGSCGTITDTSDCEKVTICWPSYSTFCNDTLRVTFYNSLLGCGGTATKIIRLRPKLSIFGATAGCANGISTFYASGGINCTWTVTPAGTLYSPGPSPSLSVDWNNLTGNFVVTAVPVNPNQVCNDSVSTQIVISLPPAKPVITGDTVVCASSAAQYCATGTGTVQWLITGGTPVQSTGNCVTVNWGNTPPFMVKAFVQMPTSPYCSSDTAVQNIQVLTSLPTPAINGSANACANGTSSYSSPTPYPAGVVYSWSIVPPNAGTITTGQGTPGIQVEWGNNAPQTASVKLTVTICGLTANNSLPVSLSPPPVPAISQTGTLCPGVTAQLNGTGGISYNWSGPGGFSGNTPNVTISLNGLYQLTVTDGAGCTALTQYNAQYVGAPIASISAQNPLTYCVGASFNVTICALGNGNYNYSWSNGVNGPASPCINVNTAGVYNVTITDNSSGCYAVSNSIAVTVIPCVPDTNPPCIPNGSVNFTYSGCNPKVFSSAGSVNATSFYWNFGDGGSSALPNTVHTYTNAGFFTVTLSAYVPNAAGTDSCLVTTSQLIEIPLLAKYSSVVGCYNDPVCFTDQSVHTAGNSIANWSWDFGDFTGSTLQNPCHTYALPGNYTVTLTISNPGCTTTYTTNIVVPNKPTAAFSFSSVNCVNSPIGFTDNSTTNINYWNWSFGNGGTSLNQNPSQSYTLGGSYPVTLIVHDIYGCYDTVSQNVMVNAPAASGNIVALPDTIVCAGTSVTLAAPYFAGFTYLWSNGSVNDTIVVASSGIYSVSITDGNGCVYSTYIKIIVNQAPYAVISGTAHHVCVGSFTQISVPYNINWLYNWISNDPVVNGSTAASVFVFPASAGTYNYQVQITDTITGCSDTIGTYTILATAPPVPPVITAVGPTTVCHGDSITLVVTHPDPLVTFTWQTGEVNDTIRVTENGCYTVTATDTYGCTSTALFCVTVNPLPKLCEFYEGCVDTCAPFTIPGPPGGTSYQWYLNGSPILGATSQNYTATLSGAYSLSVVNAFGCSDTTGVLNLNLHQCGDSLCVKLLVNQVECDPATGLYVMTYQVINQSPYVLNEIDLQVLPPNLWVAFAPSLEINNVNPGDTSMPYTTAIYNGVAGMNLCFRTYVFAYDSLGNELQCCKSDTICVVLPECGIGYPCNNISANYTYTASDLTASFTNTSTAAGGMSIIGWAWNFGDPASGASNTSTLQNPTHNFSATGLYTVCLIITATNANGEMCYDTICKCVFVEHVVTDPCDNLVAAYNWQTYGMNAYFTNQSTTGPGMIIVGYSWNFGDPASGVANTSSLPNPSHTFVTAGTHTVCLYVIGMVPTTGQICTKVICKSIEVPTYIPDPCDSIHAAFTYSGNLLNVNFTETSVLPVGVTITNWSWDFGDPASGANNTSNLQNPSHLYTYSGFSTVCLIIKTTNPVDLICYDTICKTVYHEGLHPDPCDEIHPDFTSRACALEAVFTDLSTVPPGVVITGWLWNFGDPASGANNISTLQNPTHTFTSAGPHVVTLTLSGIITGPPSYSFTEACANGVHVTHNVMIYDTPGLNGGSVTPVTVQCIEEVPLPNPADVVGEGGNYNAQPLVTWLSDVSNGNHCPEIIIRTYVVEDGCGNSTTVTQTITVFDDIAPVIQTPAQELNVTLSAANIAGINQALAAVPVATDNCSTPVIHLLSDVTTYNPNCPVAYVRVRTWNFTDDCGNISSTYTQTITVLGDAPVTTIPDQLVCDGSNFDVPILVTPFINVSGISLTLNYDANSVVYNGFTDNAGFNPIIGNTINGANSKLFYAGIFNPVVSFGGGTLITLHFTHVSGPTTISFSSAQEVDCEYAFPNPEIFNSAAFCDSPFDQYYHGAQITVKPLPTVHAGSDAIICENATYALSGVIGGGASTGIWTSSGTGSFSPSSADLNAIYTPSLADREKGFVILTLTTTNAGPCPEVSDFIRLTLKKLPTVSAGQDQEICEDGTAFLNAFVDGGASHAIWSTSGDGYFNYPNLPNAFYFPGQGDKQNGMVTLTYTTIDASPCQDISSSMTVFIRPLPQINAGPDQHLCADHGPVVMAGYSVGGGAHHAVWSGGSGLWTGDVYTPSTSELALGSVVLTYTTTDAYPCADIFDNVLITFKPVSEVSAGTDMTICENTVASLSGTVTGGATEVHWTTSGTGTFSDANILNPVYTPSASDIGHGSVVLTLATTNAAPCADVSNSITLTIKHLPTIYAGQDQYLCADVTEVVMEGYSVGGGASLGGWSGGSGIWSGYIYHPTNEEKAAGYVVLTYSTLDAYPCADISDAVSIYFKAVPVVSAGSDQTICENTDAQLHGQLGGGATAIHWTTSGTGTFTNPVALTTSYTPSAADKSAGTVVLTLSTTNAYPCADVSSSITLTIKHLPVVNAGPDQVVCADVTSVTMAGYSVSGGSTNASWSGGLGVWNNETYYPTAEEIALGHVTLTYSTVDAYPCADISDDVAIFFHRLPTIDAGPDQTICSTGSAVMTGTYHEATGAYWHGGSGSWNGNIYTPSAAEYGTMITLYYTTQTAAPCAEVTDSMHLTIQTASTLTGWVKYDKATGPLAMNNVTVSLKQGSEIINSGKTDANGNYTLTGVCPGTYSIVITTNKSTVGAINTTDAAQINAWTLSFSPIDSVKFFAGDVIGNGIGTINNRITATDATRVMQYFIYNGLFPVGQQPYTTRGDWTFWFAGGTINSNPVANPTIQVPSISIPTTGTTLTRNFYGLVTGDFNRSFSPGLAKAASDKVSLEYRNTRQVATGKVIELPVRTSSSVEVGAVSLVLNIPASRFEVSDVFMRNQADQPVMFHVDGDELRIGWYSATPVSLNAGDELLVIKLRGVGEFNGSEKIRIALAPAPENELANGMSEAIPQASLYVDELKVVPEGAVNADEHDLTFTSRPNPFSDYTFLNYFLPEDGKVSVEVINVLGEKIMVMDEGFKSAGDHQLRLDAARLTPGIYTATLTFRMKGSLVTRTLKIICN